MKPVANYAEVARDDPDDFGNNVNADAEAGRRPGLSSKPLAQGFLAWRRFLSRTDKLTIVVRYVMLILFVWVIIANKFWDLERIKSAYGLAADRYYGPAPKPPPVPSNTTVSYDHRALIIDGKRRILFTATMHYPRSSPGMWPFLLARAKAAGANAVDTYVFWGIHEPVIGEYDFATDERNLPLFLKLAHEAGLYVVLRIGPYVCAEFNNGGFPIWLNQIEGVKLRTYEKNFMFHMERFVRKTVDIVEPYLKRNGGPIVLFQMENEYKIFIWDNWPVGHKYISWAAYLAQSIDVGIPWIMCEQGQVRSVINTCNGYYCDHRIEEMKRVLPGQPLMFTELWTGWFQLAPEPLPSRPGSDVAFSSARFIAKGGSYVAYYMWHGGSNFGRYSGGPMMATSYDYDAPMNEYGFPHEPKFSILANLHNIVSEYEDVIMDTEEVKTFPTWTAKTEAHAYFGRQSSSRGRAIAFLSNLNVQGASASFFGKKYDLPAWSVTILVRTADTWLWAYCTASPAKLLEKPSQPLNLPEQCSTNPGNTPSSSTHHIKPSERASAREPFGPVAAGQIAPVKDENLQIVGPVSSGRKPLDQLRTTNDTTDYLWYIRNDMKLPRDCSRYPSAKSSSIVIELSKDGIQDFSYFWLDGVYLGSLNATERKLVSPSSVTGKIEWGKKNGHTLSIFSTSMGVTHFGSHLEKNAKGVMPHTRIKVDGSDVTTGNWTHVPGLVGEAEKWYDPPTARSVPWSNEAIQTGSLTWHFLRFPVESLCLPLTPPSASQKSTRLGEQSLLPSYALYIGGMGKGIAWVNGRNVGRYWTVPSQSFNPVDGQPFGKHPARRSPTSPASPLLQSRSITVVRRGGTKLQGVADECPPAGHPDCEYGAGYDEKMCRHGCGELVQPFIHVPFDWVQPSASSKDGFVNVVLFEEAGGDPSTVYLARMAG
ncbi:glycosyl hydrolases family 35-domain-containing protein [Zopfochytrium polystomum]|nr:glycosyl hydrolases family 35-domain-containing protein [Zopfochytrium polystomum]